MAGHECRLITVWNGVGKGWFRGYSPLRVVTAQNRLFLVRDSLFNMDAALYMTDYDVTPENIICNFPVEARTSVSA